MKHTVPRLDAPDFILSVGAFDLSVRQFLLLILAGLLCVNLWLDERNWLASGWMSVLFWILMILPLVLALAFGWIKVQGQPLERWLFVVLRYWKRPRVYVWYSVNEEESHA